MIELTSAGQLEFNIRAKLTIKSSYRLRSTRKLILVELIRSTSARFSSTADLDRVNLKNTNRDNAGMFKQAFD